MNEKHLGPNGEEFAVPLKGVILVSNEDAEALREVKKREAAKANPYPHKLRD